MRTFYSIFFCVLCFSAFKLLVATLERGGKHRCPQHPIPRGNFFATPSPPSPTVPAKLCAALLITSPVSTSDRKSTRLNSSHGYISYAVFCLKKKKTKTQQLPTHNKSIHTTSRL